MWSPEAHYGYLISAHPQIQGNSEGMFPPSYAVNHDHVNVCATEQDAHLANGHGVFVMIATAILAGVRLFAPT